MSDNQRPTGTVDLSGDLLRLAVDCLAEQAVVTLDPGGVIRSWNTGAEHLFGYGRTQAVGQPLAAMFPPDGREPDLRIEDLRAVDGAERRSHTRWIRPTHGVSRQVQVTMAPLRRGSELLGYAAVAVEMPGPVNRADTASGSAPLAARMEETTRRLAESNALLATEIADRHQAEAARSRLLRRLVAGEEDERRRIARDLHDDLGQQLVALRLTLEASERDGQQPGSLVRALAMLARIDQDLDFLAWELRPAALDELGLVRVLDTYVTEWSRHAGVRATFHGRIRPGERIAPEVEASVYRIAQEALNNVAKHARARSVNVLLEQRDEALVLIVEDDGVGLQPRDGSETTIGLTGMRERVEAVGGTLDIEPTPEGGTTVRARIPIAATRSSLAVSHHGRLDSAMRAPALAGPLPPASASDAPGAVLASARERLQELQQAVAARDEFIATVAHELRNPIAPLTFQLRLAIDKAEQMAAAGDPPPVEWVLAQLRRIEQRLHRLLETLERLLDVSRLSMGSIDLQPELMDFASAARDVTSGFEAELGVARSKLTFLERRVATGNWDRMRVEQICRNLLSNAIRYGAGQADRGRGRCDR